MIADVRPRVAVLTNGNYFANLVLAPLLSRTHAVWDYHVVITNSVRNPKVGRWRSAVRLLRNWGWRYGAFKLATYFVPLFAERVHGEPQLVATTCRQLGIPSRRVPNINCLRTGAELAAFAPDLLVSVSCPYRIDTQLLDLPRIGAVNVHSSLLPRFAGVSTYVHVLAEGEDETGATVHEMVERFDAGQILCQVSIRIEDQTSAFRLFRNICISAARALEDVLAIAIEAKRLSGVPQDVAMRSYRGEPGRPEVSALRRRGHRLLTIRDLFSMCQPFVVGSRSSEYHRTGRPTTSETLVGHTHIQVGGRKRE